MSEDTAETLRSAQVLLQNRRPTEAVSALRGLVEATPDLIEAWRLLVIALDYAGQPAEATLALRQALTGAPDASLLATQLAERLIIADKAEEAADLLAPRAAQPGADLALLTTYATALKSLRRFDQAVAAYEHAALAFPESGVAEHNLAAMLGDMQRYAESDAAVSRAFEHGLDAAETWLVHAKALQGMGDLDAAEAAFEEALRRRPAFADALGELSQLIWMRTEDLAAAAAPLDRAIREFPNLPGPRLRKAKLLEYVGDPVGAYEALMGGAQVTGDPQVLAAAAHLAAGFDPRTALELAERASAVAPENQTVIATLAETQLAAGMADAAARTAGRMREIWSLNQQAIALQATAWRLMDDPRYRELFDYERMVGVHVLDTPPGWSSLGAYLEDLRTSLLALHPYRTHPLGQSLRHGSQTQQGFGHSSDPVIQAFFQAVDGPIRRHIEAMGAGDDPLRRRRTAGYVFNGVWSVRLRPGGFHADHLHPEGWLSSACYIALPKTVDQGHEGWLKFGQPGVATQPALAAEHFVKPELGRLALFPSYMWHGTVPFTGDEPRLSVAFDLLPA